MEENIKYNNFGSKMIISNYRSATDIDVYFPEYDWTAEHRQKSQYNIGTIRCPYEPRLYNVGYIGEGEYDIHDDNNKLSKCYRYWNGMLRRCYNEKQLIKDQTYKDVIVCEEWHNFQNFAKWFYDNYYECNNETMELDKDILIKGNKIYSPKTCIFVPHRINSLFCKSNKSRGEYPIGVHCHKTQNNLRVRCSILKDGKIVSKYLGSFPPNQVNEAFNAYKVFKESYIKEIADEYKDLIPDKLYQALYDYKVEITD